MRVNWEGLANSLAAGVKANAHMNIGVPTDYSPIKFSDHSIGDFDQVAGENFSINANLFIMGIHKWGSLEYKVGK